MLAWQAFPDPGLSCLTRARCLPPTYGAGGGGNPVPFRNSGPLALVSGKAPLPQRRHPMPLAVIDGVLRDKAGLPAAQLVAAVTQAQEGMRWGRTGGGLGGWQWCVTGALGAVASCGRSHGLTRGEASEGVRGPVKGEDPPEDKVPVLKSETDEVLALAGLSHLLPGKQRASGVPSLESECP